MFRPRSISLRHLVRTGALALALGLAPACSHGQAAAEPAASPGGAAPLIPFNSNFWSYWTHYWATWLPDHPVYEMIELTAWENPDDPSDIFIRVFLTERAGRKTQYFYLNREDEVRRSRANAYFRDITYRRTGPAGGPQDLEVAFTDKDGVPIRWTIAFDPAARLRDHGDGLTPSIHSVGSVLLFALRTRTVDTHDDRVLFGETDYARVNAADDQTPGTRSWFNPDYYSAVLVYGRTGFTVGADGLSNTWGRTFAPASDRPGIYRSNALGPDNFIELDVNGDGGVRRYSHFSRGHSLDFTFEPALPTFAGARAGESIRFSAAFDGRRPLMSGDIRVSRPDSDVVVLDWTPSAPEWAEGRDLRSMIVLKPDGYEAISGEPRTP